MWEKIKKILREEGGKCIIMKEGEPTYLVKQLDDGEERSGNKPRETEKINQDIAEWSNKEAAAQSEILPEELDSKSKEESASGKGGNQEIKIEDLPF